MTIESGLVQHPCNFNVNVFFKNDKAELEAGFTPHIEGSVQGGKIIQLTTYDQAAQTIVSFSNQMFGNFYSLATLRTGFETIPIIKDFVPTDLNQELQNIFGYCHHVALKAIDVGEEFPTEESGNIASALANLVNCCRDSKMNPELSQRIQILSEATPLMVKCSIAFVKHLSSFNSYLPSLLKNIPMRKNVKNVFCHAILACKKSLFPEQLCTRSVMNEIENGYALLNLDALSVKDTELAVTKHLLANARIMNESSVKLNTTDEDSAKIALLAMNKKLASSRKCLLSLNKLNTIAENLPLLRIQLQNFFEKLVVAENEPSNPVNESIIEGLNRQIVRLELLIKNNEERVLKISAKLKDTITEETMTEKQLQHAADHYNNLAKYPREVVKCMMAFAKHFDDKIARLPEEPIVESSVINTQIEEPVPTLDIEAASATEESVGFFWKMLGY